MKRWTDGSRRRFMQAGFYLAALALPAYFALYDPANFNAQFVTVVVVFCLCAGFLSSVASPQPPKPKKKAPPREEDDDDTEGGDIFPDPVVTKVRDFIRKQQGWDDDLKCLGMVWT